MRSTGLGLLCRLTLLHLVSALDKKPPPHIILVVADDLGWNDVSWHNPNMYSPHLQSLAEQGVILEQHYVLPTCTPTRAALLTGRYPYKVGIQGHGIRHLEPYGLPLGLTTLAEQLKLRNYSTHAFGKWHLGYCNWSMTPTYRGFDTFHGYYLGSQDHYNHTVSEPKANLQRVHDEMQENKERPRPEGYDYRNSDKVDLSAKGIYSTTLIGNHVLKTIKEKRKEGRPLFLYVAFQAVHAPLQAPNVYRDMCSRHTYRRQRICEMLAAMDHEVGRIVKKLKDFNMWENSVFVFMSDNGGQMLHGGNNWPLRGNKNTLYEGGTRVPTFVAGPLLKETGYNSSSIIHVVDWLPTLLNLTGELNSSAVKGIDGVDQWPMIRDGKGVAPRKELIYNLDCRNGKLTGAIREGDLKLLLRPTTNLGGWYRESQEKPESAEYVAQMPEYVLYNITADPSERNDLSSELSAETKRLLRKLKGEKQHLVPSIALPEDPRGNPVLYKHERVFSPGWCMAPVLKQPQTGAKVCSLQQR